MALAGEKTFCIEVLVSAQSSQPVSNAVPRERPLSFAAAMVHAVQAGLKTQTRRPLYPQPATVKDRKLFRGDGREIGCPFGVKGDLLWVRERFAFADDVDGPVIYAADPGVGRMRFQQSQFMPRKASRLLLEITSTGAQQLRDITEADARAEGYDPRFSEPPVQWFAGLWDSLNPGPGLMWDDNPWVWVIHFRNAKGIYKVAGAQSPRRGTIRIATVEEKRSLAEWLKSPRAK